MAAIFRPILFCLGLVCAGSYALEPSECLKFEVAATGDAAYLNICSDAINLLYCVDHPRSEKSCARESIAVVTLHYGVREQISGFTDQGKPPIYSALCAYPQAPLGWKPERDAPYTCKKTCVMC